MEDIYSRGQAKINLALDIIGKREDGYHTISTVMQSLMLYDSVYIKKVHKPDYLKIVSNLSWLPDDERNLAWQAAKHLKDSFGIQEGIFISLQKAIPASAGLAGGSADCAATLLGIRDLFSLPLSDGDVEKLSVRFGADVPFCVRRGCVYATGIGEVLHPLPDLPYMHILLAKPPVIVSTEEIFAHYNPENVTKRPDMPKIIKSIKDGNLEGIVAAMGNVLESVTCKKYPIIEDLKTCMINNGAVGAMMSGSGPTVFGIYTSRKAAEMAAVALKTAFTLVKEIFITKPYYPDYKDDEISRR